MKLTLRKLGLLATIGIAPVSCSGGGGGTSGASEDSSSALGEDRTEERGYAPSSLVGRTLIIGVAYGGFSSFSFLPSNQVRDNEGYTGTYSWRKTGNNEGKLSLRVVRNTSYSYVTEGEASVVFQDASHCVFKGVCQLNGSRVNFTMSVRME